MRVICTYCSASKDPAKGLVPAYKRYVSPRIVQVQELAEREGAHFCILSGKFGLVDWDHPLPWYDHLLLPEEVQHLIPIVTNQLTEKNITRIDYYTRPPNVDPGVAPYANAMEAACRSVGVDLHTYILEEPSVTSVIRNWKQIMELAADARQSLITDRQQGEQAFDKLLMMFPDDGMVFFQRASGYEAAGDFKLAKADYGAAKRLFPLERWQWEAQEALDRIEQELAAGGTIAEARRRISGLANIGARLRRDALIALDKANTEAAGVATELRRCLETLVNQLIVKNGLRSTGDLDGNIRALRDRSVVPEIVSNHMATIRILGNRAVHRKSGEPPLQPSDVYPSVTALVAILEWLNSNLPQGTAKSTSSIRT